MNWRKHDGRKVSVGSYELTFWKKSSPPITRPSLAAMREREREGERNRQRGEGKKERETEGHRQKEG